MSEVEVKTITGRCGEVTQKNGWTAFHIDVGTQYPVKLSTKLDPLIELGHAAYANGGVFDWTYKESQGGENPHKPGTFYTNRYLEAVASEGEGPESSERVATPAAAPRTVTPGSAPKPQDAMTKDEWAAKDRAADLRACIAIAAGALQHSVPSAPTDADLNDFARRALFVARQFHGVVTSERTGDMADSSVPF